MMINRWGEDESGNIVMFNAGRFVEYDDYSEEIDSASERADKAEARMVKLNGALRELIEATKDYQEHQHSWELDESLEDALCAAGRALKETGEKT